jgi:hypothetical protein
MLVILLADEIYLQTIEERKVFGETGSFVERMVKAMRRETDSLQQKVYYLQRCMQLCPNNVKWQGDDACQLDRTLKESAGCVRPNSV